MATRRTWQRFSQNFFFDRDSQFALDISRMNFADSFFDELEPKMGHAFEQMADLESGGIANPDENRMVGHYWLRNPKIAPRTDLQEQIVATLDRVRSFCSDVHMGKVRPPTAEKFRSCLVIGIGGSALGPQFVSGALGSDSDQLKMYFIDNTDPDGIERITARIPSLAENLTVVISKSGGTKETRNGMLEVRARYLRENLDFGAHAVAVTGAGSQLDQVAQSQKWMARFPMWDWVGGRTSELSAVGLVPAGLQGINMDRLIEGAAYMDSLTRNHITRNNPAAMLALMWHHAGGGHGRKDMVILPYKDRLELFSRYLQQLVMESLGKELDLDGKVVNQGIAVYGNKGSTDQHAYVQQLRDGLNNFFITFIEVLESCSDSDPLMVEPNVTSGDYLSGFYLGTEEALAQNQRESLTITIPRVDPFNVGMLIALFERAVGLYASLINVNAYHQPGVEAGKKAASDVLEIQAKVLAVIKEANSPLGLNEICKHASLTEHKIVVFKVLNHLVANNRIKRLVQAVIFDDQYESV